MKKKIGIKDLEYCSWMSQEGNCFRAVVTVNGKDFCYVQDEGCGGQTIFFPLAKTGSIEDRNNYKPIDELEQWCIDNLPKWRSEYIKDPMDTTLDIVIGQLVEDKLAKGEY